MARTRRWGTGLVAAVLAAAAAAQDYGPAQDIVVTAVRPVKDIVVHAPPHCYRRSGDPADAVPVHKGVTDQRVIAPGKDGALVLRHDDEPIGGDMWQRAGSAIGDYKFRVPASDDPLCIGALVDSPNGWGQLRRIVSADGMEGRYVHFSALVATRLAEQVRFWLAAGDKHNTRSIGGDTHEYPLTGTKGWHQVDLVVGPVPHYANHISYGFLLYGGGDVWMSAPKLEVISRAQAQHVAVTPVAPLAGYGR